ncbi:MAG TPA: hypothetical protein DDW42_03430 [Desulfobacteraceae bacterium]|nr:hypothetical protein [Desulfobacteraceae bacterium]
MGWKNECLPDLVPERKLLIFPISAPACAYLHADRSDKNFNPQNTQCIPACPVGLADRTGAVKIFAYLDLEQTISFLDGH